MDSPTKLGLDARKSLALTKLDIALEMKRSGLASFSSENNVRRSGGVEGQYPSFVSRFWVVEGEAPELRLHP